MDKEKWVEFFKRWTAWGIVLANVGFISVCMAWGWPQWWININYEKSALTWFSSVQLVLSSLCALGCSALGRLPLNRIEKLKEQWRVWGLLSAGYLFLSLDEEFQFHERVREGFLKPHEIGTHLSGIGPSDFLLILYALAGLIIAWRLYLYFAGDRSTQVWLVAGLGFAILAVAIDAIDWHGRSLAFLRAEQFTEELLETAGQMCLLSAYARHFWRLVDAAFKA